MRRLLPLLIAALPAWAEPPSVGPQLGVASNFGQWAQPELMARAIELGFDDFRDEIHWSRAGEFAEPHAAWPDALAPAASSVIVNLGHPEVEGGHLPVTDEGRAAFGAFAARVAARFEGVRSIEVGNELNSGDFVSGAMLEADLPERARLYAALLAETARAARAVRPDIRILGGAAHSLPETWLAPMMEAGAAEAMDALAFHPYGVAPEWMGGQIARVRRLPGLADMPFEATEYGTTDAAAAPHLLMRAHCMLGLAGTTRLVWYALAARGDRLAPLVEEGEATPAGRAWLLARERLAGRPVRDVSPDPFTRACLYGGGTLMIWGAPRDLDVPDGVRIQDATGKDMAPPHRLSETEPLLLTAPEGEAPAIALGPQRVVADTGLQYPIEPEGADGFERFARRGGERIELASMPGQAPGGTPWRAYRGSPRDGWLRLDPAWLRPGGTAAAPTSIVHSWRAPEAMRVLLGVEIDPDEGVRLEIEAPGLSIREELARPYRLERVLDLAEGDTVEIAIGPGAGGADGAGYRIRLMRPE